MTNGKDAVVKHHTAPKLFLHEETPSSSSYNFSVSYPIEAAPTPFQPSRSPYHLRVVTK